MSHESTSIETLVFRLGPVEVEVATQAGPRIVGYSRAGGPQLFASLPDAVLGCPGEEDFRFLGGHRLWRSPEVPSITYHPDNAPVEIIEERDGFTVSGGTDRDGIVRALTVSQHGGYTVVDHRLENLGSVEVLTAPWAITQLAPGGTAILPEHREMMDPDGVLPNRRLVVWPYTDLSASEITFATDSVMVEASARESKSKVGMPNTRGWLAYVHRGELFITWSPCHDENSTYPDFGASVQCYRDERFIELETVGPITLLDPGSNVVHREVWHLRPVGSDSVADVIASLPLAPEGIGM
jgi:hypothetical protein